jgi:hypothetical protein
MSSNLIREHLANIHDDLLLLDGLDDAIIGTSQRINEPVLAVYSWEKIIAILTERDNMDFEDAVEFVEFNILATHGSDISCKIKPYRITEVL